MNTKIQHYHIQNTIFNIIVYVSWILYIAIVFGFAANAPQYLNNVQFYVKLYVSLFLLWRFNPLMRTKNQQFTELDAKIAFSSGLFLFTTTFINSALKNTNIITNMQQITQNI